MASSSSSSTSQGRPRIRIEDIPAIFGKMHLSVPSFREAVREVTELSGYRDRNFKIDFMDGREANLKISNEYDSKQNEYHIKSQLNVLMRLHKLGMKVPLPMSWKGKPCTTMYGSYFARLLQFVPGKTLNSFREVSNRLYFDIGKHLGQLTAIMDKIQISEQFENYKNIWMLEKAMDVLQTADVVKDDAKREKVVRILNLFEGEALDFARKKNLKKQLSHGDFNHHNIIVDENGVNVVGVIDFSNICYTFRMFDIAIAMCYIYMHSNDIKSCGYVLKGYESVITLQPDERRLLWICMLARACQSVVLGLRSYDEDPSNQYVLTSQEAGWKMIMEIANMEGKEVLAMWDALEV